MHENTTKSALRTWRASRSCSPPPPASTPRKRTTNGTAGILSHGDGRWTLHLLRRSRAERRSVILLLHGLPSSSRMFQPLLTRLADSYHLIAPDYPGFGHSDWPDPKSFAYTFDHIASSDGRIHASAGFVALHALHAGLRRAGGFRMALAHPERVQALIVQDAVAHNEGLGANWATRRAFWADRPATKKRCAKTCCRWQPRRRAISETIRRLSSMTPIFGPMSGRS